MKRGARDPRPTVVSGVGVVCECLGGRFSVLLAGEQTANAFAIIACTLPAGTAVPPHFHLHEEVLLLVKRGRLQVSYEDHGTELAAEGSFFVPRGSVHALYNRSEAECHFWLLTVPAGLESICAQLAQEPAEGEPTGSARLATLLRGYGLHLVTAAPESPPS